MCPACREPMLAFELRGVEIDRCPECGGTWLDAGELEQITEDAGGELTAAVEAARRGRRTRRRCPRCRRALRQLYVGDDPGLELDHCPVGHGLWFDHGEMESLIRSFDRGEAGTVSRFFAELYRDDLGTAAGDGERAESSSQERK